MTAELERALLTLYAAADEHRPNPEEDREFDDEQRSQLFLREPGLMQVDEALRTAKAAADNPLTALDHRFATAQAFHLGVRLHEEPGIEVEGELHELAASLLRSVGASAAEIASPGEPLNPANSLVTAYTGLLHLPEGEGLTADHVGELQRAFGTQLEVVGSLASGTMEFSGPGAALALLLLELCTNGLTCTTRPGQVDVGGVMEDVTFVEVDVCTNQPFAKCKRGINPLHWPECNPFFLSVQRLAPSTPLANGWAAPVKERVGCPFNGRVYETDLMVTMTEQEKMHTVGFDLVPDADRTDPRMVTVDRGFVSATDEGDHRRIRVLKVYRIEDFTIPHRWLCPLWASQVAMSPWWCP